MIHLILLAQEAPAGPTGSDMSWPAAIVAIVSLLATSGLLGAFVKILHAKARQLEETLGATVEGVESMPDAERQVAKDSIKRTAERKGVEPTLSEVVKRKTGRLE